MNTIGNVMEENSANTVKVGTDSMNSTGNMMEENSANTNKVGTGTPNILVLDANTSQVGTSSLGVNTSTTSEDNCSANAKQVGTDSSNYLATSDPQVNRSANTAQVGTVCSSSISANTNRVGSDDCSNRPGMVQPNDGTYLAVNLYKRKASLALNLLGGAPCDTVAAGSLYNGDPNRISLCHTDFNFSSKRNSMYSFDRVSMKCSCCTEHWNVLERRVLGRHVERKGLRANQSALCRHCTGPNPWRTVPEDLWG